jgi:hypothetical protein
LGDYPIRAAWRQNSATTRSDRALKACPERSEGRARRPRPSGRAQWPSRPFRARINESSGAPRISRGYQCVLGSVPCAEAPARRRREP